MNFGRVSESVYNRTIYKTIQTLGNHNTEKIHGAGLGADCAILSTYEKHTIIQATGYAVGRDQFVAARAIFDATNRMAAYGVICQELSETKAQISLQINMSADLREAKLKELITYAANMTAMMQVPIVNVQTQVVPQMDHMVTVSAFVTADTTAKLLLQGGAKPEQDVVMTKWLGLEATAILANKKYDELTTRYPLHLLDDACGFDQYLSVMSEAALAVKSDVSAMQAVRDGGIFGGLWQLAQSSGVGLVIDLKKISVKQETIEVCEFFDLNPYKILSGGSLLMTTNKGAHLVSVLEEAGIKAAIIGRTQVGNDRVIQNEEETRYLEPVREDDIFKVTW